MQELYLDPKGFQAQIDAFKSGTDSIKNLKYSLDKQGIHLQSVDKYIECVEVFNKTIELLGQMLDRDIESMKLIKAKWMNLDSDVATKTFGEIHFGE